MADLAEEEEMNAQGPARMSAVDDGLTTFRNQDGYIEQKVEQQ